jgi:hypothetical protein
MISQLLVADLSDDVTWLFISNSGRIEQAYHKGKLISSEGWYKTIQFVGYIRGLCSIRSIVNMLSVQEVIEPKGFRK